MAYTFGAKVRKLRIKRGLSARDVSKKMRIPYDTLISLEIGRNRVPSLTTALKFAKFFKITMEDLLKGVNLKK